MPPSSNAIQRSRAVRRRAGGFTLIEAALTTVIVGTGVLAIVAAQQTYHQKNNWAQLSGTAMLLANEIREMTIDMPLRDPRGAANVGPESDEKSIDWPNGDPRLFNDLDDFANPEESTSTLGRTTFSSPINALGQVIPDMEGWQQVVMVARVDSSNISQTATTPLATDTDMMRLSVQVNRDGQTITTLTWVVPAR